MLPFGLHSLRNDFVSQFLKNVYSDSSAIVKAYSDSMKTTSPSEYRKFMIDIEGKHLDVTYPGGCCIIFGVDRK